MRHLIVRMEVIEVGAELRVSVQNATLGSREHSQAGG